jgi:SAM-dependent methyltransferase
MSGSTKNKSDYERCRLCGASHARILERRGWRYHRCATCDALTKLLSEQEYAAIEPSYDPGPTSVVQGGELVREYLGVDQHRSVLATVDVGRRHPTFLDIGCGAGGALLAAKELGWQAEGVEPSRAHSTIARKLGFVVHEGFFDPSGFAGRQFDVVLMSHVVEHLLEPRGFLQAVVGVLAPGGKLVLITPNASSLVAQLSGRWWPMLKTVDHVSLLGPQSVSQLGLERFGTVQVGQAEEPWEATASLASAARDAFREYVWTPRRRASESGGDRASGGVRWDNRFKAVRALFSVTSFPVYALGVLTGKRACLVIKLTKS